MNIKSSSLLSLAACAAFAGAALAKPPSTPPGQQKKSPAGLNCPAANKVNKPEENTLGCNFSLPRNIAPHWVPATKADFIKQSGGRPFGEMKGQGMGGIRCVKFYKKKKGATTSIHRIYGGPARDFGGYWTFEKYRTNDQSYRRKFAVCKDWNDLSKSIECKLGPNQETVIAVGPGQSVGLRQTRDKSGKLVCDNVCKDKSEKYPASRDLQVVLFGGGNFCNKT